MTTNENLYPWCCWNHFLSYKSMKYFLFNNYFMLLPTFLTFCVIFLEILYIEFECFGSSADSSIFVYIGGHFRPIALWWGTVRRLLRARPNFSEFLPHLPDIIPRLDTYKVMNCLYFHKWGHWHCWIFLNFAPVLLLVLSHIFNLSKYWDSVSRGQSSAILLLYCMSWS